MNHSPKFVGLVTGRYEYKSKAQLHSLGLDYEIFRPFKLEDLEDMFNALGYCREKAAVIAKLIR